MEIINSQKQHKKDTLDVPNEIIENILIRLPVKSLLRFKAVSKKWEATISDPLFARTHLQQSKRSARQYIVTEANEAPESIFETFRLVELENQEFQVESLLKNPDELGNAYFVSYLDGMLLLQCDKYNGSWCPVNLYALWNPSMSVFIVFKCPYPINYDPFWSDQQFCGLCYDPLSEDYNVVMGYANRYAVFNCGNKCWTEMKKCPINDICEIDIPQGIYFNGSLFWVWEIYSTRNDCYVDFEIICYNPRDDKFKKMYQPKDIRDGNYPLCLALLGGHLCVYYHNRSSSFIMKIDDTRDFWMEFIRTDITPLMYLPYPYSLSMIDDNEIIMHFPEFVMAYYPREDTFKKIGNSSFIKYIAFPFVESLVLGFGGRRRFRRQGEFQFDELREVFFF